VLHPKYNEFSALIALLVLNAMACRAKTLLLVDRDKEGSNGGAMANSGSGKMSRTLPSAAFGSWKIFDFHPRTISSKTA